MNNCKICGIRNNADLEFISGLGARWGGMVFFEPSPRNLSLEEAADMRDFAEERNLSTERVALVVDADDSTLDAIIAAASPAMLQCHGDETPERIASIKARFGLPIMKAVRIEAIADLEAAYAFDDIADMMLFDSAPLEAILPGGTGHVFDWTLMREWNGSKPWLLAGGLTPENVKQAITVSGASGVDVSSGVEQAPGIKDHAVIQRFLSAIV